MLSIEEENQIIRKAKNDPVYFEKIYKEFFTSVASYVSYRIEPVEDARDLTQEIFIKALLNLKKYKPKGISVKYWLLRLARNQVYNEYRKKGQMTTYFELEDFQNELSMEEIEDFKNEQILIPALKALKESELEVIELRFFEKRSFSEVAQILEITENNAKVKTYRALDKLRKELIYEKENN